MASAILSFKRESMGRKKTHQRLIVPPELEIDGEVKFLIETREKTSTVQSFKSVAEQIAKSSIFHLNWYVPEMREKYKFIDRMKRIDKVFPYARIDGRHETVMLLVDEPKTLHDVELCEQKSRELKTLGYNYIFLDKTATLFDGLSQLGVV